MATLPALWVYKNNARGKAYQGGVGDWVEFFSGPQPAEWGGSTTMASHTSLGILWHQMQPDDLVLCWQSDRRAAVGLCRVERLDDWTDASGHAQRDIVLQLLGEPFSPPALLLDLKKTDPRFAAMRALRGGHPATLYETSAAEARLLLRACGISPTALTKLQGLPSPGPASSGNGAGFGTAAQNRRAEQAAVAAVRRAYRGWRLTDVQSANVGYDLVAVRGNQQRHIEVKGVRGPQPSVIVTRNELGVARHDPLWRLAIVTDALGTPKLREWTQKEFLAQFTTEPISYTARLTPVRS